VIGESLVFLSKYVKAFRDGAAERPRQPSYPQEKAVAKDTVLSVERIMADIRYSLRQLARNRGFAVIAVLTLALGIGVTTGIFSILYGYIIRPLPLKEPEQLVLFWRAVPSNPKEPAWFFNWRDYVWFEERSHTFQSLGASFERAYTLTGNGEPSSLSGGIASRTLFSTLGVNAFRGRLFLQDDETGPPVAIISHALWTTRFHRSPSVLGQTLTLNDKPFKVIGILPPGFSYRVLDQPHDTDVWTLIQIGDPQYKPDSSAAVAIVGRLKLGVSISEATSEIALLQTENDRRYLSTGPSNDGCWNSRVNPSYVPEYVNPASDPTAGHTWQVGAGNKYGPDVVGWKPGSVSYIRGVASPSYPGGPLITSFPCGYAATQGLQIVCPGGSGGQVYIPSQSQTGTVYQSTVRNCRAGVCSTLNN
jgi:hypothetical protein